MRTKPADQPICFPLGIFFQSKLYAKHGAQTQDPEIKSLMFYWLGQPGSPPLGTFQKSSCTKRLPQEGRVSVSATFLLHRLPLGTTVTWWRQWQRWDTPAGSQLYHLGSSKHLDKSHKFSEPVFSCKGEKVYPPFQHRQPPAWAWLLDSEIPGPWGHRPSQRTASLGSRHLRLWALAINPFLDFFIWFQWFASIIENKSQE